MIESLWEGRRGIGASASGSSKAKLVQEGQKQRATKLHVTIDSVGEIFPVHFSQSRGRCVSNSRKARSSPPSRVSIKQDYDFPGGRKGGQQVAANRAREESRLKQRDASPVTGGIGGTGGLWSCEADTGGYGSGHAGTAGIWNGRACGATTGS